MSPLQGSVFTKILIISCCVFAAYLLIYKFRINKIIVDDTVTAEIRENLLQDNRNGKKGSYRIRDNVTDRSQGGQPKKIIELLRHRKNGTFLEAGGHDGEFFSNSLYLEVAYGWTGVLVEPQPGLFHRLLLKHRRVASLLTCISSKPNKMRTNLVMSDLENNDMIQGTAALKGAHRVLDESTTEMAVTCYPLINILRATGLTQLDVLFLDVQGIEADILQTVPWEEVDIKVIVLEFDVPRFMERDKKLVMDLLEPLGYRLVTQVKSDYIYMK